MKKLRILYTSILFVGILLLILIVEFKGDYYSLGTVDVHSLSLKQELLIDSSEFNANADSYFTLQLKNHPTNQDKAILSNGICIAPSELLERENQKLYPKDDGLIVISSENIEIAAKAWVILSRKGYENVRILGDKANLKFNYSFQPDTTIRLK